MNLAIFDVDGTLLDNLAEEDECYARALCERLALPSLDADWTVYQHVSDDGIANEAHRRHHGRSLPPELREAAIARFVELLAAASADRGMRAVRGARGVLEELRRRGWAVALATGAWRDAALLKLQAGSMHVSGVPIATSEDGPARTDIVRAAWRRAAARHDVARFDRVVSVGDGLWDVQAARDLGLPFVGVGSGARRARLEGAGASIVLPDFADPEQTMEALERATIPS